MQAPAITRRRRPFLAPIWLFAAVVVIATGAAVAAYRSATTTTIIVARHAEKTMGTIEDPPLAPAGELRAQALARMFGEPDGPGSVDAIYTSDTRRARQTAAPLAARLGIDTIALPGGDVDRVAGRIMDEHRGGTVLVIGHSNTVPELVRKLSGVEVPPIGEEEYDDLYVVSVPTFGRANVVRLKY